MLAALSAEQADFLLVGAYALAAHGLVRATGVIDIWVRPTLENANKVWRALCQFGAPLESMRLQDFADPNLIFKMGLPPTRIDILMSVSGVAFDDAWANRKEYDLEGLKVFVISSRDQIINKRASGRAKDVLDAIWLERHGDNQSA
jgi:hypothetical protein